MCRDASMTTRTIRRCCGDKTFGVAISLTLRRDLLVKVYDCLSRAAVTRLRRELLMGPAAILMMSWVRLPPVVPCLTVAVVPFSH
jgi:hypothetical protein